MPVELEWVLRYGVVTVPLIGLGSRPRFRFTTGEPHVHSCPKCFEHGECVMDCECELDLSEDPGMLFGCHALCDECESDPTRGDDDDRP